MRAQTDKIKKQYQQRASKTVDRKKSNTESVFQFVDNRPEAIAQRKLREMTDNSSQVKQTAQLQALTDNYSEQKPIGNELSNGLLQFRRVKGPKGLTEIEYHSVNANGLGTKVEADLYPHDIPPGKSPPKSRPPWWGKFKALSPDIKTYVESYLKQGHLLNHHLGGEDNMDNLTPITGSTNTTMLNQYEEVVKKEVTYGKNVEYVVEADYSAHPTYQELGIEKRVFDSLSPVNKKDFEIFLRFLCNSVNAYYDVYDSTTGKHIKSSNLLWTKNEGKHLKGKAF